MSDNSERFIDKMSAIRRDLNRETRFYAQLGDLAETLQEDGADLLGHRALRRLGYFSRRVTTLRSEAQILREYATQISSEYQAQVDILQNRVMKLLTIVTTIFLPLSLIVGWYGMNFDMPELSWEYGYPAIIVVAVAVVVLLILYFRRTPVWSRPPNARRPAPASDSSVCLLFSPPESRSQPVCAVLHRRITAASCTVLGRINPGKR